MDKPKIYIIAEGEAPWLHMGALSEDGEWLTGHLSSSISWGLHDMGLNGSDWKHDKYSAHYPDGYTLEYVEDPSNHAGFLAAYEKHREKYPDDGIEDED